MEHWAQIHLDELNDPLYNPRAYYGSGETPDEFGARPVITNFTPTAGSSFNAYDISTGVEM